MKSKYILPLIMIVAAIFIISSATKDVSTYGNFDTASSTGDRLKIVGTLAKDKPMKYDAENTPNEFAFYLKDEKGEVKQVVLQKPKPQDFERSEQIVLTGKMKGETFVADEILMKCPSKYKNEEIAIKKES
ncbi:MAG: cytochrome c maturation protein CcmE [Saprospiraceae bacterium]|nr:cytochrome c maturation protein CcmE [Saprospiraceae bacterium]